MTSYSGLGLAVLPTVSLERKWSCEALPVQSHPPTGISLHRVAETAWSRDITSDTIEKLYWAPVESLELFTTAALQGTPGCWVVGIPSAKALSSNSHVLETRDWVCGILGDIIRLKPDVAAVGTVI